VQGDGGGDGSLLGAGGEAVGGVFDVGAGDHGSVLAFIRVEQDRGADTKMAVGGVGVVGGLDGALVEGGDFRRGEGCVLGHR